MKYTNTIALLNKIGEESTELYKNYLDSLDPHSSNATFTLYNSIDHRVDIDGKNITLYFLASDYWFRIEYGRKGYQIGGKADMKMAPPIAVIKKWIIDKKIPYTKGAEYKIQRHITMYGIAPKNYFASVLKNSEQYKYLILDALAKDAKEYLEEQIKSKLKITTKVI